MADSEFSPTEMPNQLLANLAPRVLKQFLFDFERVSLNNGEVLHEAGVPIPYVYFPCGGLISLFTPLENGKEAEVALVGREGMVGLPVFLGGGTARYKAIVQTPGRALRMRANAFRARADGCKQLAALLLRYACAFLAEVAQSAVCNCHHPVTQRLCRWLLMAQDRIDSDRLPFTQQFLARMLTVRLATVSGAASALKRAGLIQYQGEVKILNRQELEKACCRCYQLIRDHFDPLAPGSSHKPVGFD